MLANGQIPSMRYVPGSRVTRLVASSSEAPQADGVPSTSFRRRFPNSSATKSPPATLPNFVVPKAVLSIAIFSLNTHVCAQCVPADGFGGCSGPSG